MSSHKFVFTGPPGVGKTTAIRAIADSEPVSTEVATSDELARLKKNTTVALDYGEFSLGDGQSVLLYGTPGQERFDFMWEILARGALGLIILIDNSRPDPLGDLRIYIERFSDLIRETGAVIGITRTATHPQPSVDAYHSVLSATGFIAPILSVDIRRRTDVALLLDALMRQIEYRQLQIA